MQDTRAELIKNLMEAIIGYINEKDLSDTMPAPLGKITTAPCATNNQAGKITTAPCATNNQASKPGLSDADILNKANAIYDERVRLLTKNLHYITIPDILDKQNKGADFIKVHRCLINNGFYLIGHDLTLGDRFSKKKPNTSPSVQTPKLNSSLQLKDDKGSLAAAILERHGPRGYFSQSDIEKNIEEAGHQVKAKLPIGLLPAIESQGWVALKVQNERYWIHPRYSKIDHIDGGIDRLIQKSQPTHQNVKFTSEIILNELLPGGMDRPINASGTAYFKGFVLPRLAKKGLTPLSANQWTPALRDA